METEVNGKALSSSKRGNNNGTPGNSCLAGIQVHVFQFYQRNQNLNFSAEFLIFKCQKLIQFFVCNILWVNTVQAKSGTNEGQIWPTCWQFSIQSIKKGGSDEMRVGSRLLVKRQYKGSKQHSFLEQKIVYKQKFNCSKLLVTGIYSFQKAYTIWIRRGFLFIYLFLPCLLQERI